jgi:CyaY protein
MDRHAAIAAQKAVVPLRETRLSVRFNMPRILPTMPITTTYTALADGTFRDLTNAVLAGIEATVDRWLQDDVIDIDANRTGGLLELSFPNGSKIVLNTQPPLHELWLAARSGGFHFKYTQAGWCDTRSGADFYALLSACASEQGGCTLVFSAS